MIRSQAEQLNATGLTLLAKAESSTKASDVEKFTELGLKCLEESREILEKLRTDQRYQHLICSTVIRVNTTIAESANAGMPIMHFRKSSSGAADYQVLAEELLG